MKGGNILKKIDNKFYEKCMKSIEKTITENNESAENKHTAMNIAKIASYVFVSMYNQLVDDEYLND